MIRILSKASSTIKRVITSSLLFEQLPQDVSSLKQFTQCYSPQYSYHTITIPIKPSAYNPILLNEPLEVTLSSNNLEG